MIGVKVKVNGDISSSEDLLIEGEVNGSVNLTDCELIIGASSRVEASISARAVRIEGEIKGDIDGGERVVICASANVLGNITAPRVVLEDGGRFKGNIDMSGVKPVEAARPEPSVIPQVPAPSKAENLRDTRPTAQKGR